MDNNSVNYQVLKKYKNQIFATIAVNIITFSQGHAIAWCAPSLPLLQSENLPLASGPITIEEVSWIGSMVCIGRILGSFLFGVIANQVGRKKALYILTIPHVGFWLLVMFGATAMHLYVARFLSGISGGGAFIVIPTFVADISDNKIRGTLGSVVTIGFNGGLLSGFILTSFFSYSFYPRVIITLTAIYILAIYPLPETPQFLAKIKRNEDAENALRFYRKSEAATNEERQKFNEELANRKDMEHGDAENGKAELSYRDFLKPAAIRGLLIGLGVLFLNQACGLFALVNYATNIFKMSGSSMDPNTCTIIVGATLLIGTLIEINYVDRMGRRILLITSCLGVALGCFVLDLSSLSWIAVTSVSFSILLGSFGLSPLPFVIVTEIMPKKIKATAVTFCMCFNGTIAFIVLKIYPILMIDVGLYGVMGICGGICILGAAGIYLFMPETKGKDLNVDEDV
ncbi:LOW QUALITY PROTEIN: facilitated trehalose transporter Tret1-like [Hermetia illucens]|uniref:LOW QUALITY PROTEIN: facilitated trehalose transporter Tret1-like n=1 Tax=Hermetia illucens TaxID=343691 RepID=UPI0018CC2C9E|nr:LOW QUALITY PROTEIN: facilitated trehalose transporter Tret1-like [Hermetia illucens]